MRIRSVDPLVIEYYSDAYAMDAELLAASLWPDYGNGEGAWHTMALGYLAAQAGELAFTETRAEEDQIDWMDFLSEPSLSYLAGQMDYALSVDYVPYSNTLSTYISPAEAADRWSNLQTWFSIQNHFWVGAGPFYLDAFSYDNDTLTLQAYPAFPDPDDKWIDFNHTVAPVTAALNYEIGAPGSAFNLTVTNFPINHFPAI